MQGRNVEDERMFEADDDMDDELLVTEAEVHCPHCGEPAAIAVDAAGGAEQDYVEDCPVCCRPWLVHVRVGDEGDVEVWVESAEE